jgi:magnesium-transporting ATPase (P-type)
LIRDGEEVTIPSSEVRLDDTVLLTPGDKVPGLRAAAIRASTVGA